MLACRQNGRFSDTRRSRRRTHICPLWCARSVPPGARQHVVGEAGRPGAGAQGLTLRGLGTKFASSARSPLMSKVVSFPRTGGHGADGGRSVVVVTDADGSTLAAVSIMSPSGDPSSTYQPIRRSAAAPSRPCATRSPSLRRQIPTSTPIPRSGAIGRRSEPPPRQYEGGLQSYPCR
jgi:hypothetical protein